jgi:class 3 adenylate cyclase/tetratricopeptide (TPR) repeat protein
MRCSVCGTENEAGRKFCQECGSALSHLCPTCGASNNPAAKFCGECGSSLAEPDQSFSGRALGDSPTAERRLVSVLFADLVGFTPLAETLDPEEVRDILTRYFDVASRIVQRYGGMVEKFIGDAVMAVWGTPSANEDDAERAVRAALDLTSAVASLGQEIGAPDLRARAGVLTGEAAVALGAQGQGMVAGDLVNTAARIQAAAEPGTVLVGDPTMRVSEAAVVYEDAGLHELKGKAEPIHLWRAMRVIGLIRGALKSTGLEAPFVGREREFRLVKDLFHASAEQGRAHLVSVWGIAGIGKSRLSWEFSKYIHGVAQLILWHRGRCLPYGEGVTYWALAEMVRSRAGIAEGEEPGSSVEKVHATVLQYITDPEEQRWVEPRLLHLLGLEDRSTREPEELFSAWRLFFERLAAQSPVVLVFEDLQWAESALLDFIEYLLEWSRNHALFVMTLARPELQDRHPDWGAGKRNLTSMALEPLSAEAMGDLLTGLAPGLPDDVQAAVLDRAEGVPLYAVETIRMLIDRGLLVLEGPSYRPIGPVAVLEVPDSLHALIAARLDGLTPEERRLVQHAAVLGKTFTTEAVAALSGVSTKEVAGMLASLQRKEILGLQSDPRSPERGQYGFLQDLVKHVAYETLSRRDRRSLHLAAARYLEQTWTGEEEDVVEILAHHLVHAYQAAPDAPDAPAIRAQARTALVKAGERAASLAANGEAHAYFDRAFELADDPAEQAAIAARAGETASAAGRRDAAKERFERAIALFNEADMSHAAAMVSAKLAEELWVQFSRLDEALEMMESSLSVLAEDEPDEAVARLMAQAARFHYFRGELDESFAWAERALVVAEAQQHPWVLSQALNTKSLVLSARGRMEEGLGLLKHALTIAEQHNLSDAISRGLFNLGNVLFLDDRCREALEYDTRHLEHARLLGVKEDELMTQSHLVQNYVNLGRWAEVDSLLEEVPLPEGTNPSPMEVVIHAAGLPILLHRGKLEELEAVVNATALISDPSDMQDRMWTHTTAAMLRWGQGQFEESLEEAEQALLTREALGLPVVSTALTMAIECALELGRVEDAERLLRTAETAAPSEVSRFLRANVARLRARMAATASEYDEAESGFKSAQALFREIEYPLWLGMTQLEHAEFLVTADRASEAPPLLAEARAIFSDLGAKPWLERTDRALQASRTAGVVPA